MSDLQSVQSSPVPTDPIIKRKMEHSVTMLFKAICHMIDGSQLVKAAYLAGMHINEMKHIVGEEEGGRELVKVMSVLINNNEYENARVLVLGLCDIYKIPYPNRVAVSNPL